MGEFLEYCHRRITRLPLNVGIVSLTHVNVTEENLVWRFQGHVGKKKNTVRRNCEIVLEPSTAIPVRPVGAVEKRHAVKHFESRFFFSNSFSQRLPGTIDIDPKDRSFPS
jgi:hypothetical protein